MRERARTLYRQIVPSSARKRLREAIREAPIRARDISADIGDYLRQPAERLPPAALRERVGIDSGRKHFVTIGQTAFMDIATAVEPLTKNASFPRWLDFGCGAGRVARHAVAMQSIDLAGVDVDEEAIRWCQRHLRGSYMTINPEPPTAFADCTFDIVYAVSVFTHFDEEPQLAWLEELRRLLRPGGLLVATTHGPHLTYNRPDITPEKHTELRETGFLFMKGVGDFNEDSAFHARDYLERRWGEFFRLVSFKPSGLVGYLDLAVWQR